MAYGKWTSDEESVLIRMRSEGASFAAIGRVLNRPRSSVYSKADRIGLENNTRRDRREQKNSQGYGVWLADLEKGMCRDKIVPLNISISGRKLDPDGMVLFCGEPVVPGTDRCIMHTYPTHGDERGVDRNRKVLLESRITRSKNKEAW